MSRDDNDVNCGEVLDRMTAFLDHELNDRVFSYTEIEAHLVDCGQCLSEYDLERVIKEALARSCACEHAPEELRRRVLARIHEVRTVEITDLS
jgi:mycothiol system anti-sigma-R factor